jgi:hypothetical protein
MEDSMQCAEGRPGRIFIVRIDHGEDLLGVLEQCIREKEIHCGVIQVLGALGAGKMVSGPEEMVLPPYPHWEDFNGGWEMIGLGTISWSDDRPHIHLHSAAGKGNRTLTGCLREKAEVYIVTEAVITEISGVQSVSCPDRTTGLSLPRYHSGNDP